MIDNYEYCKKCDIFYNKINESCPLCTSKYIIKKAELELHDLLLLTKKTKEDLKCK